ncbi:hypothetical protein H5410_044698 [Solanum commersonii]|uniref:MoaB/Mog domain-containing protein n=1 Tax=Solanum commersonii TaxID=4109 RepID=A0A9J5XBM5_SOLCO|nr:hypothetical protein H5410_044698 [Solanum commersonii]
MELTKIIKTVQTFPINFCQSTQNRLTKLDTDPTPTPTPMSCRRGCGTKSEESEQLRYTSIGSIHDTVPNALLCTRNSDSSEEKFKPAYLLADGRLERAGRAKKNSSAVCGKLLSTSNGLKMENLNSGSMLTASIITVGDEILFGTVEDKLGSVLCKKLHSIGWAVSRVTVTRNDIDSVAEEVERLKSRDDMVFIYGGIGPLHSDVTVAGVAKAFGVRMAPDEEFEEHLRHLIGEKCSGDKNEILQQDTVESK